MAKERGWCMETLLLLLGLLAGSSVLGIFLNGSYKRERAHKQLIANAMKSALRRVEMFYRIRRRIGGSKEDLQSIRDDFHDIQQENDYYKALLAVESRWHGERYVLFIDALQRETGPKIQEAWKLKKTGPQVSIAAKDLPDVKRYEAQFAKDSRRLLNPLMRSWMWCRDSRLITWLFPIKVYNAR
jgi:hypothetical protein